MNQPDLLIRRFIDRGNCVQGKASLRKFCGEYQRNPSRMEQDYFRNQRGLGTYLFRMEWIGRFGKPEKDKDGNDKIRAGNHSLH